MWTLVCYRMYPLLLGKRHHRRKNNLDEKLYYTLLTREGLGLMGVSQRPWSLLDPMSLR